MSDNIPNYPKEFLELLSKITNKRARVVIDHIMKYGFITTEELQGEYGYTHAPRAAMDVKDAGIPIETFRTKSNSSGRLIGAYKFGDLSQMQAERVAGRIAFSKAFKHELYEICGGKCQICNGSYTERTLQIDHRVPYEVSGDLIDRAHNHFMLLCGSCNRAKSWSCEQCENWKSIKKSDTCLNCYWGSPENYNHIALLELRRIDITWNSDEVKYYDAIRKLADDAGINLPQFIKNEIAKIR